MFSFRLLARCFKVGPHASTSELSAAPAHLQRSGLVVGLIDLIALFEPLLTMMHFVLTYTFKRRFNMIYFFTCRYVLILLM